MKKNDMKIMGVGSSINRSLKQSKTILTRQNQLGAFGLHQLGLKIVGTSG